MVDCHENRISYIEAYIDECEIFFRAYRVNNEAIHHAIKDFEMCIKKIEEAFPFVNDENFGKNK